MLKAYFFIIRMTTLYHGITEIFVITLLITAKIAITTKWKDKDSPTILLYFAKPWDCYRLGKRTDPIAQQCNKDFQYKFTVGWYPIIDYIVQ